MPYDPPMARVLVIFTGGTISMRHEPGSTGNRPTMRGAELLASVPGLAEVADIEPIDWGLVPASHLSMEQVLEIGRILADRLRRPEIDGAVVVQGTDTIEETAFLAWLLGGATAARRSPIVFTGAMRNAADPDTDGPANLAAAVALAAGGPLDGGGPVVHLGGATHHARWATKTDTGAVDSFRSPGARPVADPPPHGAGFEGRVAQVPSHTGVDGDLVAWHLGRGARGVVVEGTGAGNVHADLMPGIEAAVGAGVPVVVTSRCWTGAVSPTYGRPGGGHHLADLGCIGGGDLPTHKARLALGVALGADPGPDAVRAWFGELLREEVHG